MTPDSSYASHPVVFVTWFGAWAFAKHYNLRLPTEQEWEKAARGNTGYDYPWGDTIAQGDANYWQSGDPCTEGTTPVGYYNGSLYGSFQTTNRPSPYGAYDMAGNVWEWTDSFYGGSYPSGRVLGGGSWFNITCFLPSWFRIIGDPSGRSIYCGFRCATSEPTSVGSSIEGAVRVFSLNQNYPNPFNPSTTIRYGLPNRSHVSLTVFNTLGQQVSILRNGEEDAGYHEVQFNATNLPSGVYFYRLRAGDFVETKRLLLIR